jgi:hypothetical protein
MPLRSFGSTFKRLAGGTLPAEQKINLPVQHVGLQSRKKRQANMG